MILPVSIPLLLASALKRETVDLTDLYYWGIVRNANFN